MRKLVVTAFLVFGAIGLVRGQEAPRFGQGQLAVDGDFNLPFTAPPAALLTVERTVDLLNWEPLVTLKTSASNVVLDSGAPYFSQAFYRTRNESPDAPTGDHVVTSAGSVVFHPVFHAGFVISWNGLTIYNDPYNGASRYAGFPAPDLILISHEHTDHFDTAVLTAVRKSGTIIIAPRLVYNGMSAALKAITTVLTNGTGTNVLGIQIDAIPAYNSYHPRGNGNGYILTIGGKRIYMSSDTGDIAEMRALRGIDVAFVCMNVPFTMTVSQAVSAVRDFAPRVAYPYHFRNQDNTFTDLNAFKRQVGTDRGIEVRIRKWY